MKRVFLALKFFLMIFLSGTTSLYFVASCFASASDTGRTSQKLPVVEGREIVVMVGDEPITLEEFNKAVASIHEGMTEERKAGKIGYSEVLNRLINTKLILFEARNIGINELPEIKDVVDKYSKRTLIGFLRKQYIKNVDVDEEEVNRLYKGTIKEWKIKSILFEKEEEARKIEEELKASGGNFDDVAKRLVADGKAKGSLEGEYLKDNDLLPQIAEVVSKMEFDSVSPVIQVSEGFVILRLEGMRISENPEIREQVRQDLLKRNKEEALEEYDKVLIKKYVKIDEELLDTLDYDSSVENFQGLLKDSRVVAEIKDEAPVTVGELSEALEQKYFHNIRLAIEGRKLNDRKRDVLDEMLRNRVFIKEALKQGIDRTGEYKNMLKEYEDSLVFGAFVQKVIVPDIKIKAEELQTYYNENIDEYLYPEMMRINSLVFVKKDKAEDAINILKKGTDFKWLSANVEGKVNKDTKGLLEFEGNVLITKYLPEDVQKAISGVNPGDFRLYASPDGYFYALYIQDVFPSKPQPFEKVKKQVRKEVFNEKLRKALEVWADKLKEFYMVKIYITEFEK